MSDLEGELEREIVYDHYSKPRRYGKLGPGARLLENPSCGDKLSLSVAEVGGASSEPLLDLRFEGRGCSISQASASMMVELLSGKTREEALEAAKLVLSVFRGEADPEVLEPLGDVQYLAGVAQLPVRVKCAALAWQGIIKALEAP